MSPRPPEFYESDSDNGYSDDDGFVFSHDIDEVRMNFLILFHKTIIANGLIFVWFCFLFCSSEERRSESK